MQRHPISSFPGSVQIQRLDCNNHSCFSSTIGLEPRQAGAWWLVGGCSVCNGRTRPTFWDPQPHSRAGDTLDRTLTASQLSISCCLVTTLITEAVSTTDLQLCSTQPFAVWAKRENMRPEFSRQLCRCSLPYDGARRLIVVKHILIPFMYPSSPLSVETDWVAADMRKVPPSF